MLAALAVVLLIGSHTPANGQIERISIAGNGSQANAGSYHAVVSDDGSVIAFRSNASNLVADDSNGWPDIFVRDIAAGTTERVSLLPSGAQSASYSKFPSLSGDGLIVAFEGRPAANSITVTAIHDRSTGITTHLLPRVDGGGNPIAANMARLHPALSGNGQLLAFHTRDTLQSVFPPSLAPTNDDSNLTFDVFVLDLASDPAPPIERVSRSSSGMEGRGDSLAASISHDGRYVAFHSFSDNLSPDDANTHEDVFLKDRDTGVLELISATPEGRAGNRFSRNPMVSGNGRFVAFRSLASDLVVGDTNQRWDIFVRDRLAGTTERVSVSSSGEQANHNSLEPSISNDGRFVVFRSLASNLVEGDTNSRADVFVHDRQSGQTAILSAPPGDQANGHSSQPAISGNGQWIVFESDASNLVADDTNSARDIFRAPNPLFANVLNAQ